MHSTMRRIRVLQNALPSGPHYVSIGCFYIASVTIFLLAAYELNSLCFALSPVALLIVLDILTLNDLLRYLTFPGVWD